MNIPLLALISLLIGSMLWQFRREICIYLFLFVVVLICLFSAIRGDKKDWVTDPD